MRIRCHLREHRRAIGDPSLREFEETCGVSRGSLSQIENGRRFATDGEVPAIEAAYGVPAHEWYDAPILLALERDHEEALA